MGNWVLIFRDIKDISKNLFENMVDFAGLHNISIFDVGSSVGRRIGLKIWSTSLGFIIDDSVYQNSKMINFISETICTCNGCNEES